MFILPIFFSWIIMSDLKMEKTPYRNEISLFYRESNASWLPPSKGKESNAFEDQTLEPERKQCFRRPNVRAGKKAMLSKTKR